MHDVMEGKGDKLFQGRDSLKVGIVDVVLALGTEDRVEVNIDG